MKNNRWTAILYALAAALFFVTVVLPAFLLMPDALRVVLILLGLSGGVTALLFAPRFMQTAEPRKCPTCGRTFLPSRGWLLISALRNRWRQTPCPACRKKARRKTRAEKASETKTKFVLPTQSPLRKNPAEQNQALCRSATQSGKDGAFRKKEDPDL